MHQPSKQAQLLQASIADDEPFIVPLGKYRFKARRLKSFNDRRISVMIVNASPEPPTDTASLIRLMSQQGTLSPRCLSRLILGSYWKILLFHPIFWRWIDLNFTQQQLTVALTAMFEAMDLSFFFQNFLLLDQMNTLKMRMTKTELKQLSQELLSEKRPAL